MRNVAKFKWAVLIALCSGQFVMVLDSTVMNVSIQKVIEDLDTKVQTMQLAIATYTLTTAALMLIGGKLGDIIGRRLAFRIGLVTFGAGRSDHGAGAEHGDPDPRLVDPRGDRGRADDPGDHRAAGRQLRGPRPRDRLRGDRRHRRRRRRLPGRSSAAGWRRSDPGATSSPARR